MISPNDIYDTVVEGGARSAGNTMICMPRRENLTGINTRIAGAR
jgi:hypothetical protein